MNAGLAGPRVRPWRNGAPSPAITAALAAGGDARLDRDALEALMIQLVGEAAPPSQVSRADRLSAQGCRLLLDRLEQQPGDSWAQRWDHAAGAEDLWSEWQAALPPGPRSYCRAAIDAAIVLHAVRPSSRWLLRAARPRLWGWWVMYHDAGMFNRLRGLLQDGTPSDRVRVNTMIELARITVSSGKRLEQLDANDFLAERAVLISVGKKGALHTAWTYAHRAGLLADQPMDFTAVLRAGQRTPVELVAAYRVDDPRVRALFVDYLTERQTTCDYSSLTHLAGVLLGLFWGDLQTHLPGKSDLALTAEQATAWRQRVSVLSNGQPRKDLSQVVSAVRGLYLDLSSWAVEDPARWAVWVRPCPFTSRDSRRLHRHNEQRKAAWSAARTRTLAVVVPQLVSYVGEALQIAETRLRAAEGRRPGEEFQVAGRSWRIPPLGERLNGYTRTRIVADAADGSRVDLTAAEDKAFWAWAVVEVLRHSGIRIEELLELTHLSIRAFRKPDGQLLPLLQIAPSKTNTERVLPASPQLAHALSRIITRHLADQERAPADHRGPMLPLVSRRDDYELTFSPPMPFLFQRRLGSGRRTVMHNAYVRAALNAAAAAAGLRDTDGTPLRFTPHDFRRLFLTDVVTNGLPIHIAAQLAGHDNLNTTRGYVATYPTEVFAAYDAFLTRRRAERPADEYRRPTAEELTEFAEHFGRRRVELGDCVRPYGSGCSHEHACIRCDYLHVTTDQAARLHTIEHDLDRRIDQARQQDWIGDVEQLNVTLNHLRAKKHQVDLTLTVRPTTALLAAAPPLTMPSPA